MPDLGPSDVASEVVSRLADRKWTIAVAESLTGGGLGSAITAVPGASAVFLGGVVSYATSVKRSLLGVSAESVVSDVAAHEMADGVRTLLGSDVAVSLTGVAGPDEQEGHPVGTIHLGLVAPGFDVTRLTVAAGDRSAVRRAAVEFALRGLLDVVDG